MNPRLWSWCLLAGLCCTGPTLGEDKSASPPAIRQDAVADKKPPPLPRRLVTPPRSFAVQPPASAALPPATTPADGKFPGLDLGCIKSE
jgi:hypothetical protein